MYLVGGLNPFETYESVRMNMEKIKNVPNHQPDIYFISQYKKNIYYLVNDPNLD